MNAPTCEGCETNLKIFEVSDATKTHDYPVDGTRIDHEQVTVEEINQSKTIHKQKEYLKNEMFKESRKT